jgi:ankyrin repeat protein
MYRALCGALDERRGCRLLFAAICADIAPSVHVSLGFRQMVSAIPSSCRDYELGVALSYASLFCLQDATLLLVRAGASIDGPANALGDPLRYALVRHDADHVQKLLILGASPNFPDAKTSETAMHEAARWGNRENFSDLIRRGGDPYKKNRSGLHAYDLLRQSRGIDSRSLTAERNQDRASGRSLLRDLMGDNGWFGWRSRSSVDVV